MIKKREKIKRFTHSLYVRMVLVIIFGVFVAIAFYTVSRFLTSNYIEKYYVTEDNRALREEEYIRNLQGYITENKISSSDTDKIARWAQNNKYVYLLVYKNNELFYSSDMPSVKPNEPEDKNEDEDTAGKDDSESGDEVGDFGDEAEGGAKDETDKNEGSSFGSGITVDFPSREELKKYAEENDLHEIETADGLLLASIAEFTEYLYYDLANIMSLVIAMVALVLTIIIYFRKIIYRVKRLDYNVMAVANGDINKPIASSGYDEIARLSGNVENMRCTIIESIEEEREARRANTELITAMSHDIRTPLTVLLGYLDMMKSEAQDERMRAWAQASENTAMRLKNLSDDMFNYFLAYGSTKENFDIQSYDAATLFDQLLSESVILLREKGYEVEYDYTPTAIPKGTTVKTDAPKLMRIVDNLFSNLSKYADSDYPVTFLTKIEDKTFVLEVKNRIKSIPSGAESNGIGLKTCQRLAAFVAKKFEYNGDGEYFTARLEMNITTDNSESEAE